MSPTDWDKPRHHGIVTVEDTSPHAKSFNPQIDITYNGSEIATLTKTAVDGTQVRITFTWTGGNLTQITRYVLL